MKWMLTICLLYLFSLPASSQTTLSEKTIDIEAPTEVSIDRACNIYFAQYDGDIIRFDSELEQKQIFSPSNPTTINILEAWQGLRIFSFQKDLQQYRLINRNLSLNEDYPIPNDLVGFAELATPSFDNNIWVIDQLDFSLKKINIQSNRLESSTALDLLLDPDTYEILHCREYQNRLFISTKNKGILIFDNLGNYIKTYNYYNISYFNFWEDELYFLENSNLKSINLYNEKMKTNDLPSGSEWQFVLVFDNRIYLFSAKKLMLIK